MIKSIIENNEMAQAGGHEMEVLKAYFPQCFTPDGAFDIEKFRQSLPEGLSVTDETSGFNFLGKSYAHMLCNMDTTTVIRPDTEHNCKPENRDSQNVYISGDNLDALQHLVKSYAGEVKVIYIDPPYNTGSDGFVYNDKFRFTSAELAAKLGVDEERASRILSMTRRGSASHAAWLTFMLPRLWFARELLTKDGVIFISIDDNEQANLKCLCDDVFGEENFQAMIAWQKRYTRSNNTVDFTTVVEPLLVYSKDEDFVVNLLPRTDEADGRYTNPDNDPRGPWKGASFLNPANPEQRPNLCYPITNPNTGETTLPTTNAWRRSKEVYEELLKEDKLYWGLDGKSKVPSVKMFLSEARGLTPTNFWEEKYAGNTDDGTAEINELFGARVFTFPKPVNLVKRVIEHGACQNCIVLDFFGGSSTTAHAVMQKNSEDGGTRKYILVQWPELCKEDSEAYKAGYRTIDQIGMERIKRAAAKIKQENPIFAGDLGFKHYTLEEPKENVLLKMEQFNPDEDVFSDLTAADFGIETVLRTWMVRDGYGLTEEAEVIDLDGYKAYYKKDHLYFIEPEDNFTPGSIAALMDKYNGEEFSPKNLVIFGYSFGFTHREELQKNLRTLKDGNKSLNVNIDVRY